MIHRNECVLCNHSSFSNIILLPNFPITSNSSLETSSEKDTFFDYHLVYCKNCKCVQLKTIVPINILYSSSYETVPFSETWIDHHRQFSKFIQSHSDKTSYLEIGSNTGILYKLLDQDSLDFTVLDMFRHESLPKNVKFIKGDCEKFDYKDHPTIILSHVFEHLSSPPSFIKKIREGKVTSVFISIPNFDELVRNNSITTINAYHSFFCGIDYITYLFSIYQYRSNNVLFYNGNFKSIMIHFVLDETTIVNDIPTYNINYFDFLLEKSNEIKNIIIPEKTYICPSGMYGQYIYYFLTQKQNIIGFIDNNSNRHGKKLYGTGITVFHPTVLEKESCTILLCKCPYTEELKKQLLEINKELHFIIM